jgi:hypothetical protein
VCVFVEEYNGGEWVGWRHCKVLLVAYSSKIKKDEMEFCAKVDRNREVVCECVCAWVVASFVYRITKSKCVTL